MAASVVKKRGNVLAFVSGEMGGVEYTGRIQNGVLDSASARGYTVTVHRLGGASCSDIVRKLIGWRVAGVIFHVPWLDPIAEITEALDKNSIPYGTVNLSNPGGIGVTTDDAAGIESAVKLLHDYGHRKPVFFTNMKHALYDKTEYLVRREAGFRRGMEKYYPDQTPVVFHMKDSALLNDAKYMRGVVETFIREKADGVICESDLFASHLSRTAQAAGYQLPEVFSLVGFGNSIFSVASYPCLTTVSQNFEQMGADTVRFVADVIEKRNPKAERNILLPVEIMERDSVKILNGKKKRERKGEKGGCGSSGKEGGKKEWKGGKRKGARGQSPRSRGELSGSPSLLDRGDA
jgi:LacI family transcriptional regulator